MFWVSFDDLCKTAACVGSHGGDDNAIRLIRKTLLKSLSLEEKLKNKTKEEKQNEIIFLRREQKMLQGLSLSQIEQQYQTK